MGWLVRLQRRLGPHRRALGVGGLPEHRRGGRRRPSRLGTRGTRQVGQCQQHGRCFRTHFGPRGHHPGLRRRQPARRTGHRTDRRAVCSLAIELKFRLGFDDSVDVVGVHLIGGIIGTLLIGLFATDAAPNKVNGLLYGGGFGLLGIQTIATAATLAYSFAVTWVIAKVLDITVGLRIDEAAELRGIDIAAHSESAYLMDEEPVELGSPHRV